MRKLLMGIGFMAVMVAGSASAQGFYLGGGVSSNSLDPYDDETGFQFFGGFDLMQTGQVGVGVEVGYMDAGEFGGGTVEYCETIMGMTYCADVPQGSADIAGLWATGVADYALTPRLSAIGRAGLDFGDDDGLMFGAGLGFDLSSQIEVRGEYVIRDNVDSAQLNLVFRP